MEKHVLYMRPSESLRILAQSQTLIWRWSFSALAAISMAASGMAQSPAPSRSMTIRPGISSQIPLQTLPNAECTLRAQGSDNDADHSLKLYADGQGVILVQARPSGESTAQLELNCTAGDTNRVVLLELRADKTAQVAPNAAALRTNINPQARSGASTVRPALQGDPALLSNDEILQRGYPARPDVKTSPDAYAAWLKAVSKPATYIRPETVERRDRFHGPAKVIDDGGALNAATVRNGVTSTNWSGYVATAAAGTYTQINGDWHVPSVTGEVGKTTYSSYWVGVDGWGSGDVVQAGTEQEVTTISFFGARWVFTSYYPWYEWYPAGEVSVSNFSVSPGDEIFLWVTHGYDYSRGYVDATFWFENITAGTYTTPFTTAPAGASFVGNSAEWVMERPTVGGSLADLSDYGVTTMCGAYVWQPSSTSWKVFNQVPGFEVSMYNGSTLLSSAWWLFPGSQCLTFDWNAFQ